ncbi:hypothetical protein MCETHM1_00136 [Flavobacteriaceae bacterium]
MKLKLIVISILFPAFFIACQSKKSEDKKTPIADIKTAAIQDMIPYTVAQNYFVKNTVDSIANPKIETEEAFKTYFGFATTMGKNGKPTAVDFAKEFAIALVLPKTDVATTIVPVSLKKGSDDSVVFQYKIELGDKQSYTSRPFLLVVVDKKFDGNVSLKLVK